MKKIARFILVKIFYVIALFVMLFLLFGKGDDK